MRSVTKQILRQLYDPPPKSHKGENGEVLVIGGSARYHGAPLLAARMAAKIVDFVYFSSTPENNALLRSMKKGLAEFIAVPRREIFKYAVHSDCILMGPGLGLDRAARLLVNNMLRKFPEKKFVLDAGALRLVDLKVLRSVGRGFIPRRGGTQGPALRSMGEWQGKGGARCILTPHREEFRALFKCAPTSENAAAMAKKYGCVIVLKGSIDIVCRPPLGGGAPPPSGGDSGLCRINRTGNAGMTKGGTGDVMSGLIAGLAAKNDLFLAACAGAYVNGLAGDRLKKRVSYYFSASDLIQEVPKILTRMQKKKT